MTYFFGKNARLVRCIVLINIITNTRYILDDKVYYDYFCDLYTINVMEMVRSQCVRSFGGLVEAKYYIW